MNTNDISAIIEEGCKFEGNLSFNGVARIAGIVNGSIFSNNTVIISEGAIVSADINANIIHISGNVKGNLVIFNENNSPGSSERFKSE